MPNFALKFRLIFLYNHYSNPSTRFYFTVMSPKVSVIVPVYNQENYLKKCMDSLISQTFQDIEIICFNDASTDNSLSILQEYAATDKRIQIIDSQVNIKQGGGRNAGLKASQAEYVAFIDSDDWIADTFVEDLYTAIKFENADIAFCDYFLAEYGKYTEISPLGDCEKLSFDEMRKKIAGCGIPIWTALYRKNIIVDNDLLFPENVLYEDNAVGKPIQLCAKRYAKVNKPLYYYRIDNTSTLRSHNNPRFYDRLPTAILFKEHCIRLGLYDEFKSEIDYSFLNLYFRGTIIGIYEKFDSIPYDKISDIKQYTIAHYGYKKMLSYIRSKSLKERCILTGSIINPRFGKLLLRFFKKLSDIKHYSKY